MSAADIKRAGSEDDIEKSGDVYVTEVESTEGYVSDIFAKHEHGWAAPLWKLTRRLNRYGVEARGIERVPADERWQKPYAAFFVRIRHFEQLLIRADVVRCQHEHLDVRARHAGHVDLAARSPDVRPDHPLL